MPNDLPDAPSTPFAPEPGPSHAAGAARPADALDHAVDPDPVDPSAERAAAPTLRRGLKARHIRFIALGSAIGTGLFYGSASAVQQAGPSVLLAYLLGGMAVFVVMRALGEMTVRNPVSGSFGEYAHTYLGRFAGYVTGWTFAFEMAIVAIADVTAFGIYMGFWFPDVPRWTWVAAIICVIAAINLLKVSVFGEVEFWLSLVKVVAIVAMIVGGALIVVFGFSLADDAQVGASNLVDHGGFFPNGIGGFLACFTVVMFAFGGIETIGISAGEADRPAQVVPRAINTVPVRILVFYVFTLAILMMLSPWDTIGDDGSPFVQIFDGLGIPAAAHILNAVVITAALSAINSDVYSAGRMLFGLSRTGNAPASFGKVSKNGVPWMTVVLMAATLTVGVVLNALVPDDVFLVIASLATFATVWVWLMILASHVSMRRKIARGELGPSEFPVPFWPVAPVLAIVFMVGVVVMLGVTEATRVSLVVGVGWIALLGVAYAVARRRTARARVSA